MRAVMITNDNGDDVRAISGSLTDFLKKIEIIIIIILKERGVLGLFSNR